MTDAAGRFAMTVPSASSYNLEAVRSADRKAWLPEVTGGQSGVLHRAPTGTVRGRITLAPGPTADFLVFLRGSPYVVRLAPDGTYEVQAVPAGDFQLWIEGLLGKLARLVEGLVHLDPGGVTVVPDRNLPELVAAPSPAPSGSSAPTQSPAPSPTPSQSPATQPLPSPSISPTSSPSPTPSPSPGSLASPAPSPSPTPVAAAFTTVRTLPVGGTPFSFIQLGGVAVDAQGNVYVADNGAHSIFAFSPGSLTKRQFFWPGDFLPDEGTSLITALAISREGHVLAADWGAGLVWDLTPAGGGASSWNTLFGSKSGSHANPTTRPIGVAVDPAGNASFVAEGDPHLYLASGENAISRYTFATHRAGLAIDPNDYFYTSDEMNHRIHRHQITAFDRDLDDLLLGSGLAGLLDAEIGFDAKFRAPSGLAADGTGNIYIADNANNAIRRMSKNGTVVTIAGRGINDAGSADGPVNAATFNNPTAVAVAPDGALYVIDFGNQLVRVISR